MIVLYGIPNCDTCRKARKWLDAAGLEYRFHDLRRDGVDAPRLRAWLKAAGPDRLLNRRGMTWRGLDAEQRTAVERAPAERLPEYPTLIKRPVLEVDDRVLVGFSEPDYRRLLE